MFTDEEYAEAEALEIAADIAFWGNLDYKTVLETRTENLFATGVSQCLQNQALMVSA
ncbi:hypothetical protein ACI2KR_27055 [Pseudomonas luteola]